MDATATGGFLRFFSELPDPRTGRHVPHKLHDLIVIAILAIICGADGWAAVSMWGKCKFKWLSTFLDLPGGIASHDTFGRVFSRINPDAFERCFLAWMSAVVELSAGRLVAIDGKAIRRSFEHGWKKNAMTHLVSAFVSQTNKRNELKRTRFDSAVTRRPAASTGALQKSIRVLFISPIEKTPQFLGRKNGGQALGPPGAGKLVEPFIAAQGHAEEKLQGATRLVVQAPARASLLDQPQQVLANLLAGKLVGRSPLSPGELRHGPHVRLDGVRGEVAKLHVLDQSLSKCGHLSLLVRGAVNDAAAGPARRWRIKGERRNRFCLRPPRSGLVQRMTICGGQRDAPEERGIRASYRRDAGPSTATAG